MLECNRMAKVAKVDKNPKGAAANKARKFQGNIKYMYFAASIIAVGAIGYFVFTAVNSSKQNVTDNRPSAEAIAKSREATFFVPPPEEAVASEDRQALLDKYYKAAMSAKEAGRDDEAKENAVKFLGLVLSDPESVHKDQPGLVNMVKLTGKKAVVLGGN